MDGHRLRDKVISVLNPLKDHTDMNEKREESGNQMTNNEYRSLLTLPSREATGQYPLKSRLFVVRIKS